MFRDTQEELERLQAQLLAETQEQTAQTQEEDLLEEEDFDALLSDADQGEAPRVYQNYSNGYGRELRNFATGYRAYNTDKADVDLEEYSQEVFDPPKAPKVWPWILLTAVVVGVILWLLFSTGGLF